MGRSASIPTPPWENSEAHPTRTEPAQGWGTLLAIRFPTCPALCDRRNLGTKRGLWESTLYAQAPSRALKAAPGPDLDGCGLCLCPTQATTLSVHWKYCTVRKAEPRWGQLRDFQEYLPTFQMPLNSPGESNCLRLMFPSVYHVAGGEIPPGLKCSLSQEVLPGVVLLTCTKRLSYCLRPLGLSPGSWPPGHM